MCIWAARLCLVLVERVMKFGKDARFDRAKHDPAKFLIFRSLQGLWVFVTLLHTFALHSSTLNLAFGLKDFIGFGIWAVDCACLLREGFNKKMMVIRQLPPGQVPTGQIFFLFNHTSFTTIKFPADNFQDGHCTVTMGKRTYLF